MNVSFKYKKKKKNLSIVSVFKKNDNLTTNMASRDISKENKGRVHRFNLYFRKPMALRNSNDRAGDALNLVL